MTVLRRRKNIDFVVAEKAMTDEAFRRDLLANPKAALKSKFNLDLPSGLSVVIHEESADSVHLVIPPMRSDELSDAELEAVAGGGGFPDVAKVPTSFGPIPIPYPKW